MLMRYATLHDSVCIDMTIAYDLPAFRGGYSVEPALSAVGIRLAVYYAQ